MSIRILLVDDHTIVREGFRTLLEGEPGMAVVGEAENGARALDLVRELKPDVVVMDVRMPVMGGIEATGRMIATHPGIRVIGLTMYDDARFLRAMQKAGASGYLLKDAPSRELFTAIRTVMAGKTYLSPSIPLERVTDRQGETVKGSDLLLRLTPREREIMGLLSQGRSVREIADHLGLNLFTVHTHRRRIMTKLDVKSISELVKFAIREGITTP